MTDSELYIAIGKKIKSIREEKGLTQQNLADLCEFEKSNLSRIEAGKTNITIKNLYKISKALGVQIKSLVDLS
ncbi:MAG: transcriptional regulator [Bacteroidetes bacterium GWE2_39_28]|nr:MAG: transcriptional regulator [Bacteroidetes bacterium GWE2_39_28]OFY12814.1 MAG: transcriptional regulator [Bacteroidetes bacterium GWF2_39_10]OFZ11036.1 MAG: transcriptional regulator [Bacteroidetes bacterium RIFOXYC2_FULL_39_11]HCT93707.1 XRE family transcriptional regulator [Rikenellaceae bacterium]